MANYPNKDPKQEGSAACGINYYSFLTSILINSTAHTLKLLLPLSPKFISLIPDPCSSPGQTPPLKKGCKEQLLNNKTPRRLRLAGDPKSQACCCCCSHYSCSHEDMSRAQKRSSALPPKEKFTKFLLALQQLCLTQFNSLNQQKNHWAAKTSISFTFNKPRSQTSSKAIAEQVWDEQTLQVIQDHPPQLPVVLTHLLSHLVTPSSQFHLCKSRLNPPVEPEAETSSLTFSKGKNKSNFDSDGAFLSSSPIQKGLRAGILTPAVPRCFTGAL